MLFFKLFFLINEKEKIAALKRIPQGKNRRVRTTITQAMGSRKETQQTQKTNTPQPGAV